MYKSAPALLATVLLAACSIAPVASAPNIPVVTPAVQESAQFSQPLAPPTVLQAQAVPALPQKAAQEPPKEVSTQAAAPAPAPEAAPVPAPEAAYAVPAPVEASVTEAPLPDLYRPPVTETLQAKPAEAAAMPENADVGAVVADDEKKDVDYSGSDTEVGAADGVEPGTEPRDAHISADGQADEDIEAAGEEGKSYSEVMLEEEDKNSEPAGPVVDLIEEEPPGSTWVVPQRDAIREVLREFTGKYHRTMQRILNRSGRYLPMVKQILREEGLPEELAVVAMIESSFVVNARSPAGAVGIWQFIPSTAKLYGLEVNQWVDQRMDPELATRSALRYLRDLRERLCDWDLAIAGYNTGGGNIQKAQDRCREKDFWSLVAAGRLRRETQRYVPKFYAFLLMSSDPKSYGFEINPDPPVEHDTVMVKEQLDIGLIAKKSGLEREKIENLNAALLRSCTPPSPMPYPLRVPKGYSEAVASAIEGIPESEKFDYVSYNAKSGESVEKIAKRYGVDAASVIELNRLTKGKKLKKGQKLAIAVPRGRKQEVSDRISQDMGRLTHKVRRGETVAGIARVYGVGAKDIIAWNSLGKKARISVGQELVVSREAPVESVALKALGKYVVSKGDTPWSIARENKITVKDLFELNKIDSSDVIKPGDTLKVVREAN